MNLRPYQSDALTACRNATARGLRRMVVAMPTGGGKTIVFAHLPNALGLSPHDRVLVLAHRDELIEQARDKYLRVNPGEIVGIEKAERKAAPMDRVVIGSVQTLQGKRLKTFLSRWTSPRLVVTDEAHHATATSYRSIYDTLDISQHGNVIHVGVTATPKRADNVGLSAVFEEVVYNIGISELIDQGYLVPLRAFRVQTRTNLDSVRTLGAKGDFNLGDLDTAVNTSARNDVIVKAYLDVAKGQKALVFCTGVDHSKGLASYFERHGIRAEHVDGTTPIDERRDRLARFSHGDFPVLCNCAVLTEGYDEPSVEVIIIARPTKSSLLYTQMIGRGTRIHPGKQWCTVIDVVDNSRKHSVVTLPVLLGLPPSFNLKGRDAHKAAAKWKELAEKHPAIAANIVDVDRLMELPANLEYAPVDLFKAPAMPEWLAQYISMTWVPLGDDSYRLGLAAETVVVEPGALDGYVASVHDMKGNCVASIGDAPDATSAFAAAEKWVRDQRGEQFKLVDPSARWRGERMSGGQREFLVKYAIPHHPEMTKGDASALITRTIESWKSGRRTIVRR
jgi:ATP-dependent helicase IRC3